MKAIITLVLLVTMLGACSKAPESNVEPSEVIPSPSATLNPEDSSENVSVASLKYGQSFTYLDGVKLTVSKPRMPKEGKWIVEDEGQVSNFDILFEAPNGWMQEELSTDGPHFGFRTVEGDITASIACENGMGPFFDNMSEATKKNYHMQLISPEDSFKTGTVTLEDMSGTVASWS